MSTHPKTDRKFSLATLASRRAWLGLAALAVTGAAGYGLFWWWRWVPRCDPAPITEQAQAMAEMSAVDRIEHAGELAAVINEACPVVSWDYFLLNKRWLETRIGRAIRFPCDPADPVFAEPSQWRDCAALAGYPLTVEPDRLTLRSQMFFEREGVPRDDAHLAAWSLRTALWGFAPITPSAVETWTSQASCRPHDTVIEISADGTTEGSLGQGLHVDARRPCSDLLERVQAPVHEPMYLSALSLAHGDAFPDWVWLPIQIHDWRSGPPCLDDGAQVRCADGPSTAAELSPGALVVAREDRRARVEWSSHAELVAQLHGEALARFKGARAHVVLVDAEQIEWRDFVSLVDFFAPTRCQAPVAEPESDAGCCEPFVDLHLTWSVFEVVEPPPIDPSLPTDPHED